MSEQPLTLIRRLFEAVEARDVEPMYEIYSPDVVVCEADCLPYGGEFHGYEGMVDHGLRYVGTWDALQTDEDRDLEAEFFPAEDRVFVSWRQKAHAPGGEALDEPMISEYRVEDGHVVASRMHAFNVATLVNFLERQAGEVAAARR